MKRKLMLLGTFCADGGSEEWMRHVVSTIDRTRVEVVGVGFLETVGVSGVMAREFDSLCPIFFGRRAIQDALEEVDVALCCGILLPLVHRRETVMVFVAHSCGRPLETESILRANMLYDRFVAVSEEALEQIPEWRLLDTTIVHNMIDPSRLTRTLPREEVRESLGLNPTDTVIGYLGRLAVEKNLEVWFQTLSRLPRYCRGVLVGDGCHREWLMDRARLIDSERFIFTGVKRDIGNYLGIFDRFLHMGHRETCCLAVGEAILSGVPVVARRCGLTKQHEELACLLSDDESESGLDECARILYTDLQTDPSDRVKVAREVIETHYNPVRFGEDWTEVICTVTK